MQQFFYSAKGDQMINQSNSLSHVDLAGEHTDTVAHSCFSSPFDLFRADPPEWSSQIGAECSEGIPWFIVIIFQTPARTECFKTLPPTQVDEASLFSPVLRCPRCHAQE